MLSPLGTSRRTRPGSGFRLDLAWTNLHPAVCPFHPGGVIVSPLLQNNLFGSAVELQHLFYLAHMSSSSRGTSGSLLSIRALPVPLGKQALGGLGLPLRRKASFGPQYPDSTPRIGVLVSEWGLVQANVRDSLFPPSLAVVGFSAPTAPCTQVPHGTCW